MIHEVLHPKYGLLARVELPKPPTAAEALELLREQCALINAPMPAAAAPPPPHPPIVNRKS